MLTEEWRQCLRDRTRYPESAAAGQTETAEEQTETAEEQTEFVEGQTD